MISAAREPSSLRTLASGSVSVGSVNTCELNVRACGVGERTEDIEDGALTDLLARTDGILHGRMKLGGKHKPDANVINGVGDLFGREIEADTESGEHIRGTAMR